MHLQRKQLIKKTIIYDNGKIVHVQAYYDIMI